MISSFHQNSDLFYFISSSFKFLAIIILLQSPSLQNHIMSITSYALFILSNSELFYFISSSFQVPAITILLPSLSLQNHIMSTTSYDLFIPSKLWLVLLHLFFFPGLCHNYLTPITISAKSHHVYYILWSLHSIKTLTCSTSSLLLLGSLP
jgi:hypothetical protein